MNRLRKNQNRRQRAIATRAKRRNRHRPVVNTVVHEDKEVYLVQFHAQGKPELGRVVASGNHPFWVQGEGWLAVEYLEPGQVLELKDGTNALVHSVGKVRHTHVPDIGWAADDRNDVGVILDLSGGTVKVASEEITRKVLALDLGEAFKTRVYNFEVEEFHTYYVEALGVWVHNTNCTGEAAIEAGIKKTDYEAACFSGDTLVLSKYGPVPIENIRPGEEVLSRCEKTGEMGWRKVLECFVHEKVKILHVYTQTGQICGK